MEYVNALEEGWRYHDIYFIQGQFIISSRDVSFSSVHYLHLASIWCDQTNCYFKKCIIFFFMFDI